MLVITLAREGPFQATQTPASLEPSACLAAGERTVKFPVPLAGTGASAVILASRLCSLCDCSPQRLKFSRHGLGGK